MKADLHCHSVWSDGTCSPAEIALMAKQKGCDLVVVTDHDTTLSFKEVQKAALEQGLAYLTGIEISTLYNETPIHILGYAFDPSSPALHEYEQRFQIERKNRAASILEKLRGLGIDMIAPEEFFHHFEHSVAIGRPHIAQVLVEKGYASTVKDAFISYLGYGKPAYVPTPKVSIEEAITLLHNAKGIAVLAHPHLYGNKKLVRDVLDRYSFDGIEVYYAQCSPQSNAVWARCASEYGLLPTGGSDFHGEVRPDSPYGVSLAPEDSVDWLWKKWCESHYA